MELRHVVFYVSAHGLGHLTRCVEVATALFERVPARIKVKITFVTSFSNALVLGAERSAVEDTYVLKLSSRSSPDSTGSTGSRDSTGSNESSVVVIRDRDLDAGAIQRDAFCIDVDATRDAAMAFHANIDRLIDEETRWLEGSGADLVVSDVVGLALPAARRAGICGVLMTNFSWGFIYRPFVRGDTSTGPGVSGDKDGNDIDSKFQEVVSREDAMLDDAVRYFRLPGYSEIEPRSLDSRTTDVPLIVRAQREGREAMRRRLGIGAETKVCLLMVGGHSLGVAMDWWDIDFGGASWVCFVTASVLGQQTERDALPPYVRVVAPEAYIPDWVAMADVVVGKIGYGTVSECLAAGTPLVYVPRKNFAEERDMVSLLEAHRAGLEMSRETFLSGRWGDALASAVRMRPGVLEADTSGASAVADELITLFESRLL